MRVEPFLPGPVCRCDYCNDPPFVQVVGDMRLCLVCADALGRKLQAVVRRVREEDRGEVRQ